jgi:hypothetical protein
MPRFPALLVLCFVPLLAACSAGKDGGGNGALGGDSSSVGGDSGLPDTDFVMDSATGDGASQVGCSDASKYVYVLDQNNSLYKFDPSIASWAAFTRVGVVDCGGNAPNSMAISRDGVAYVNLGSNGYSSTADCVGVSKVSIKDASCLGTTPFACGSAGFGKFGMGFSTNSATTTDESLFLGNTETNKLGSLDPATGATKIVASLPSAGAELTGNAAGELWAFMPQTYPPSVAQIDKQTGAALKTFDLPQLPSALGSRLAWAFAFWGGDYYLFYYSSSTDSSTNVWRLKTDGTLTKYIANTGLTIVGAGVSTCAPLSIQ